MTGTIRDHQRCDPGEHPADQPDDQQRGQDQAKADDKGVDPGEIGKAGGNAHDLGLLAVEKKTLVHFVKSSCETVQAIGSGPTAALTNSSEARKAPAKLTASWRVSRKE